MNKTVWAGIALIILVGGGWYLYAKNQSSTSAGTELTDQQKADQYGSVKPETTQVVAESMQGKWQSTSDPKSQIEIKADGTIVDWYDGKQMSSGALTVFTKVNAPAGLTITLDDNAVYAQVKDAKDKTLVMDYRVTMSADANTLTMIYLEGTGHNEYRRIQ